MTAVHVHRHHVHMYMRSVSLPRCSLVHTIGLLQDQHECQS